MLASDVPMIAEYDALEARWDRLRAFWDSYRLTGSSKLDFLQGYFDHWEEVDEGRPIPGSFGLLGTDPAALSAARADLLVAETHARELVGYRAEGDLPPARDIVDMIDGGHAADNVDEWAKATPVIGGLTAPDGKLGQDRPPGQRPQDELGAGAAAAAAAAAGALPWWVVPGGIVLGVTVLGAFVAPELLALWRLRRMQQIRAAEMREALLMNRR